MPILRNTVTVIVAAVLILLIPGGTACGKERDWYKYENAYFEVYSDASEKRVRRLLEELENFRAAVVQMLNMSIPAGAVKTQVVVFRSASDFQDVVDNRRIAAFMVGIRGVPYMVMPIGRRSDGSEYIIRHEYTHVLMGYSEHRFPKWYSEGFAEFMSGTRFRDKGKKFTLGDMIPRRQVGDLLVPWSELMSEDFDIHAVSTAVKASNAYYQAWLMAHYLTIGEHYENYRRLGRYLGRFSAGESSISALEAEFGMTPEELGDLVGREYRRRMPYYTIEFRAGVQDHEFVREEVDASKIKTTIADLRERWRVRDP